MFSAVVLTLLFDSVFGGGKIYGGCRIDITKAPYMVHLNIQESIVTDNGIEYQFSDCGGSILKTNLILTAAHCVKSYNDEVLKPDAFKINVGSNYESEEGVIHKVKKVHPHPKYGVDSSSYHDVALLELTDHIKLNERAQLLNLAGENDTTACGSDVFVSGWGRNPDHSDKRLYQVHLNVVSSKRCVDHFGGQTVEEFNQHQICVQTKDKSDCQGDSGGPLIDTKTNLQIGLVSYGDRDCTANVPSVFCKVTDKDNLAFIDQIVKKARRTLRDS